MGNFLEVIKPANLAAQFDYKEIGTNDELGLIYNSNGKNYQIVSVETDAKYTLVGDTVNKICERTGYEQEDIMALLFIVYNAYDNYSYYLQTVEKDLERHLDAEEREQLHRQHQEITKKVQENLVNTTVALITKFNYQDVYHYLGEMTDVAIVNLFTYQTESEEYGEILYNLTPDKITTYNGEEEELVSRQFYN